MKFLNIIDSKLKSLQEQGPGEIPAADPAPVVAPQAPEMPAAPTPTDTAPETSKPLTPEGEVFLVRLLRKALFMNPGELDEKLLSDLPEINENNAAEVLNKIVEIMKKYSSNIDVET